jgi:deazaflavin-dependent oxidoreductase (nitroreductase family)
VTALLAHAVPAVAESASTAGEPLALQKVEDQSTVKLVTKGRKSGLARTVTIWFVRNANRIYVQSGKEGKTDWYRNVLGNPAVTLEFDGLTLRGEAHTVDDAGESERVHGLFRDKYLTARVMGWFGGGFGSGKIVAIDKLEPATR